MYESVDANGYEVADEKHGICLFLDQYLDEGEGKQCLEIGNYPGSFLAFIGQRGYTVNGIDYHENNSTYLKAWLEHVGCKTGAIDTGDFFEYQPSNTFDLVVSFGFIEHFGDYLDVIDRHSKLVKPGGRLIITTPNFAGFMQKWLHKTFDADNLEKHNIESMNPKAWKAFLIGKGFEVEYAGHFGKFFFWTGEHANNTGIKKFFLKWSHRAVRVMRYLIRIDSRAYSSYCGIVAVKADKTTPK